MMRSSLTHLEPAATLGAKRAIHAEAADLARREPHCAAVLLGDWNFVHADDPRIDLCHLDMVAGVEPIAAIFEKLLAGFVELEQAGQTRRQFADGSLSI